MLLHEQTWPWVENYLKNSKGIILPIGSTEQHGPMGMIGTDALCAEVVGMGIGKETGHLVGPTFNIGMAQHHLGFPGSMTLRPSTLIAVIKDAVTSLVRGGFREFYFINGHGGNINTVQAAFAEIYADTSLSGDPDAPNVSCKLANWFTYPSITKLVKETYGDAEGAHATPSEISLTWFYRPHAVQHATLEPRIAPMAGFTDSRDYRRNFPDGRMGADSSLATMEAGKMFFETAVRDGAADVRKFFSS